jgi:hypothetical protein
MARYRGMAAGATSLVLVLSALGGVSSATASTTTSCAAGAHTLAPPGSRLYPDTGNGGYTSLHTDVHLVYDATTNQFLPGNHVTLTDRSTQCLSSFSLDFERRSVNKTDGPDMAVASVRVNGRPASFTFVQPTYPGDPHGQNDPDPLAHQASEVNPVGGPHHNPLPPACTPELTSTNPATKESGNGTPCPANKLVITPATPVRGGSTFQVTVAYTGRPGVHNDGDGTTEGWFRSNQPAGDGGFVTTEPVGTEDWMPLNDYPSAKPTYDFYDTVNAGRTVLANGILEGSRRHPAGARFPHGSVTWHWHSAAPVASYLVEDSVGRFDLSERTVRGTKFYQAQASSLSAARKAKNRAIMDKQPDITRFESQFNGPYPFSSGGVVVGPAGRLLRGGDADDDHLRGRDDRYRHPLPREHAPVVGRSRHRVGLPDDVLQGGAGHPGRVPVRGPEGAGQGGWPGYRGRPPRVPGQPGRRVREHLREQGWFLDRGAVQPDSVGAVQRLVHV